MYFEQPEENIVYFKGIIKNYQEIIDIIESISNDAISDWEPWAGHGTSARYGDIKHVKRQKIVDINSDEIIVTLSGNRVIPGPSPFYNSTYPHIWQLINPPPTGNNQSAVQVVVDLDKDIMDSGIFKRIDTNGNVKCSMIWRRVGNVIHVTGYRQPIGNATGDVDAVELLPVVPQSHVDDGDDVYNSLFGNGVLRDGDDASAPVPIICKANDQGGTIASQNCAVQFFRYDDLSNPIKDFGNGDIRFSFSYDLKN